MITCSLAHSKLHHLSNYLYTLYIGLFTVVCSCLIPLSFASNTFAADYKFSSIEHLIEQKISGEILSNIYRQLDTNITIIPMKAERAELEATAGLTDGEVSRVFSYGDEHPSVLRVPTSFYQLETMAFFKAGSNISLTTIEDLKQYRVAYIKGVKHTDKLVRKLNSNTRNTDNTTTMIQLIQAGRVDVGITSKIDGQGVIKKLGLNNIKVWEIPTSERKLYHYLHSSNAELLKPVDSIIKKMKISGQLQKLVQEIEQRFISEQ